MALTSTLFTGLSGLDVNQTRLNVVGNNIANVNTVAFKSSRALFTPQFYVTDSPGAPAGGGFGGTNPNQRGLGVQVSSIEKDFTQGAIEPTGRKTDLAVDGLGFFIVGENDQKYTRDGSFTLNNENELVTAGGEYVQGYGVDEDYILVPTELGRLNIPLGGATAAEATSAAQVSGNLNAGGDLSTGSSVLNSQSFQVAGGGAVTPATLLTDLVSTDATPVPLFGAADVLTLQGKKGGANLPEAELNVATATVQNFFDFMNLGLGIDTAEAVGTGTAGAGLRQVDPTTFQLALTGNTGTANALALDGASLVRANNTSPFAFSAGTDAAGNANGPVGESKKTTVVAYDSLGTPVNLDLTLSLTGRDDTGTTWKYAASSPESTDALLVGTGTVTFDNNGKLIGSNPPTITVNRQNTGAEPLLPIELDFSGVTALTDTESVLTGQADGFAIGSLSDYSIGEDGRIVGSFTNGLTRTLGQVAVATFRNSMGLIDTGGNMYTTGSNSGDPQVTTPGALEAGFIRSGSLELSNVDLSKEFTNLIIASTGFSASSRVISTSDQLLTELLNTSR